MLDWPILLDERLRDELVTAVVAQPARMQLLRGPSGIGKTTIAAAITKPLVARGLTVLPIVALSELSTAPLAAMAPLLALTDGPDDEPISDRLQRLFSLVAKDPAGHVLMIDDGPMLDEISASAVYQLVRVYGVRGVMTAREDHTLRGPLARLADEGAVQLIELRGMTIDQARVAVERALAGTVEPDSLKKLTTLADGNPLFLRELVLAAEQGKAITSGPLGLVVDVAHLPPRLRDSIALRFRSLSPDQRALAELIAVGEPWPESRRGESTEGSELDILGLVDRTPDGLVYLSHSLYAETLIRELGEHELNRRRIEAAERIGGDAEGELRFKAACLLLETTSAPPAEELTWAATYAYVVDNHELAVRLARRSLLQEASFDALLVLAKALAAAARLDEAQQVFSDVRALAATDEQRALLASAEGNYLAMRRLRPAEAVRLGREVIGSVEDSPARSFLAADLAQWRLMTGDLSAATSGEIGDVDGPIAFNGLIFRLVAALFASELDVARVTLASGRELLESARPIFAHGDTLLTFAEFWLTAFEGPLDDAFARAEGVGLDPFGWDLGLWNYGVALFSMQAGKVETALELATAAVEKLAWRDFTGALGAAIGLRATAAAQLGERTLAQGILATLDEDARGHLTALLQAAEAEAWLLVQDGDDEAAAAVIARAVDRGIEARHFGLACLTAHVAVRIGQVEPVLEQLRVIAGQAQGGLVAAMAGHAEALAANDEVALLRAATELARVGLLAGAVDAAQQAARLSRAGGRAEAARRASLRANGWEQGLSGIRPGAQADRSYDLSEREWSVAVAAAGRERSREIAERLGLSVRTVDNHLNNVYRKLGVSGRDGLRKELDGLPRLELRVAR